MQRCKRASFSSLISSFCLHRSACSPKAENRHYIHTRIHPLFCFENYLQNRVKQWTDSTLDHKAYFSLSCFGLCSCCLPVFICNLMVSRTLQQNHWIKHYSLMTTFLLVKWIANANTSGFPLPLSAWVGLSLFPTKLITTLPLELVWKSASYFVLLPFPSQLWAVRWGNRRKCSLKFSSHMIITNPKVVCILGNIHEW